MIRRLLLTILLLVLLTPAVWSQPNWVYGGVRSISGGPVLATIGTKVNVPSPIGDIGLITIADISRNGPFVNQGSESFLFVKFWHISKFNADVGLNLGPNISKEQVAPGDLLSYAKLAFGVIWNQRLGTIRTTQKDGTIKETIVAGWLGATRTQKLEDNLSTNQTMVGGGISWSI